MLLLTMGVGLQLVMDDKWPDYRHQSTQAGPAEQPGVSGPYWADDHPDDAAGRIWWAPCEITPDWM